MYSRAYIPGKGKYFSVLHKFHTGYGFYPSHIRWVQQAISQWVRRPERQVDPSTPSSVLINISGAIPELHDIYLWRGA
jgi:hypothetical protein